MPRFSNRTRKLALVAAIAGAGVGGCTPYYTEIGRDFTDRRETVVSGAADAVASNQVVQMVDPWPRHAADNRFSYNGEKMAGAAERYRTGRVIPPVGASSSGTYGQQAPAPSGGAGQGAGTPGAPKQ